MRIVLDWRHHTVGPPKPCVLCGQQAFCRDIDGTPCHKVCAEAVADRIADHYQAEDHPAEPGIRTEVPA